MEYALACSNKLKHVPLRRMKLYWFAAAVVLPLQAQITAEQTEFFEKKIRPVLAEKCYGCHGPESKPPAGGLRIHTREGLRKGGDNGPAIVPGDPAESSNRGDLLSESRF